MPPLRKKSRTRSGSAPRASKSAPATHSHTGFLVVIVLAVILLIVAGVMLFLSWISSAQLIVDNMNLEHENSTLETAKHELEEESQAAIPFYYVNEASGEYTVRSIDADGGDELVYTNDTDEPILKMYAQPKVGFDGRIILEAQREGDSPSLALLDLDVTTGAVKNLELSSELPHRIATSLSPDETMIAAVYDNPEFGHDSLELKVWNILDGGSQTLTTLEDNERFALAYDGLGGSYGQTLSWTSVDCVSVKIFEKQLYGANTGLEYRTFCL
ncbi:MAG TPA: hypothetical protein QF873_03370 [Patescibacteria group bacterium]|nr:hypothetical protein [Patescibacteria group bacterium]